MYSRAALPEDTIWIDCEGAAGQSFGAFAIQGLTLNVDRRGRTTIPGKGLSGGKIIVTPPAEFLESTRAHGGHAGTNIVVGNVALYGATSGEAYFRGDGVASASACAIAAPGPWWKAWATTAAST